MNDIGIDKKQQRYIMKKMINIAIRATYYVWISRIQGSLQFWWNSVQRKALMRIICSREIFTKKIF